MHEVEGKVDRSLYIVKFRNVISAWLLIRSFENIPYANMLPYVMLKEMA